MRDNPPTMHTGPRPDIKDIIGLADRFFVMLNNDDGITLIPKVLERVEKAIIVALMQANGRFVQHIENSGKARADL